MSEHPQDRGPRGGSFASAALPLFHPPASGRLKRLLDKARAIRADGEVPPTFDGLLLSFVRAAQELGETGYLGHVDPAVRKRLEGAAQRWRAEEVS